MILLPIARGALLALEALLALPLLYLLALAVGAAIGTIRRPQAPDGETPPSRFAIVVPAHDEEALIGTMLSSLARIDYPAECYDVHIIADNCTDRTAEIAREAGVHVQVRMDLEHRGKGYALSWAFNLLMNGAARYDAYIVLDADAVVDPGLLRALARGLARGAAALQSQNAVLNAAESPVSALRWLALSLMNYIRPLGRNTLGGSSTLTGNGMCLTHELLMRHPWQAFGLSEDYQYYLSIIASGEKVLFVPDADVRSVMPTTSQQLQTQDIRWESINPDASAWQRRIGWSLLSVGLRHHSWVRLDALAEMLTPPLSVLGGGSVALLIAAVVLQAPIQVALAVALVAMLAAYVASAFVLLRPPLGVYRALVYAPAYVARKLWIYFVLRRLRKNTTTWVRTSRTAETPTDVA
ncbi:MAG TPA: glycosyltransferase family 2 protein [Ktedonobacterales bacterium]|nr:glycosyltransferase family 2 protein [Ktedonobacterales bacterium]